MAATVTVDVVVTEIVVYVRPPSQASPEWPPTGVRSPHGQGGITHASQGYHLPWVTSFTDQTGFDSWFARSLTGPNVGLVAREVASNKVVGVVNINEIVAGAFQSAYLGYYGMASFSRQGLMTKALRAAVSYAFGDLGLHRLEANIQPENIASITLVRRLGFQKEGFSPRYLRINGQWRDHERWALLADTLGEAREASPKPSSLPTGLG